MKSRLEWFMGSGNENNRRYLTRCPICRMNFCETTYRVCGWLMDTLSCDTFRDICNGGEDMGRKYTMKRLMLSEGITISCWTNKRKERRKIVLPQSFMPR